MIRKFFLVLIIASANISFANATDCNLPIDKSNDATCWAQQIFSDLHGKNIFQVHASNKIDETSWSVTFSNTSSSTYLTKYIISSTTGSLLKDIGVQSEQ